MPTSTSYRTHWLWLISPLILFVVALLWVDQAPMLSDCLRDGDHGLLLLDIQRVLEGEPTLGPYSRYQFRHPGPAMYFLLAAIAPTILAPLDLLVAVPVAQLLINLAALLLGGFLLRRLTKEDLIVPTFLGITLAWFAYALPHLLTEYWNPTAVVIPYLSFLIAAALAVRGDLIGLCWCLILGTVIGSHHLGTASTVAPILFMAIVLWIKNRDRSQRAPSLIPLAVSICVVVALSLPILLNVVTHQNGGNIGKIMRRVVVRDAPAEHTLKESIPYIAQFLERQEATYFKQNRQTSALFLVLLIVIAFLSARMYAPSLRGLVILATFSLVLAGFSVPGVRGPLYPYLMMYVYSLIAILVVATIAPIILRAGNRPGGGAILIAGSILLSLFTVMRHTKIPPPCSPTAPALVTALEKHKGSLIELSLGQVGGIWGPLGGVFFELRRRGVAICGPKGWEFMFGETSTCRSVKGRIAKELPLKSFVLTSPRRLVCPESDQILRMGETILVPTSVAEEFCSMRDPTGNSSRFREAKIR